MIFTSVILLSLYFGLNCPYGLQHYRWWRAGHSNGGVENSTSGMAGNLHVAGNQHHGCWSTSIGIFRKYWNWRLRVITVTPFSGVRTIMHTLRMWDPFGEGFMSSQSIFFETGLCSKFHSNGPFRSNLCANLFTGLQLWVHKLFVQWVAGLMEAWDAAHSSQGSDCIILVR